MRPNRLVLMALLDALTSLIAPSAANAQPATEPIRLAFIEGLSGALANAGEAVFRNLLWATKRVNARGGVKLPGVAGVPGAPGGARPLALVRFDSKGNTEEALGLLRCAMDQGIGFGLQGNRSATAAALVDALEKHDVREPQQRALLLNYSAVDPALTNDKCSFWHFRFDGHADMRLVALTDVLQDDRDVKRLYLIGQDYSFGQQVLKQARVMVGNKRGNDLTLLVRALREVGAQAKLYTSYSNALGAPAAIGEAGLGRVLAAAEWFPNAGGAASEAFYASFKQRFPDPRDDYVHVRMHVLIDNLAAAIERAGSTEAAALARALESSGFGFRTLRRQPMAAVKLPHTCRLQRPD
jgi:branched-chain amino acid transport system substrate-binding protein